ncbi:hypothetical protein [Chitinophaga alhagiae]|uniref:hypothetical protein n=1 Tax=Chitinophaga alhagiae TaxID=2203219 RepID=UPI00130019D1|nr:hypothetical protein [Chitinophaga alhagiae]
MKTILVITFCSLFVHFSKAQTTTADNKLSQTITFRPIPKGPSVLGVFQGRPPCAGLAGQLQLSVPNDCIKLKCDLVLYRQPATFTLYVVGGGDLVQQDGNTYRRKLLKGKWSIVKGLGADPEAAIYVLDFDAPKTRIYLFKGNENVLFFLDNNKQFRVGNEDFSYTLNRVELVAGVK